MRYEDASPSMMERGEAAEFRGESHLKPHANTQALWRDAGRMGWNGFRAFPEHEPKAIATTPEKPNAEGEVLRFDSTDPDPQKSKD